MRNAIGVSCPVALALLLNERNGPLLTSAAQLNLPPPAANIGVRNSDSRQLRLLASVTPDVAQILRPCLRPFQMVAVLLRPVLRWYKIYRTYLCGVNSHFGILRGLL